jgi:hypothetical protein
MVSPSWNSARYVGNIAHPFRSRERVVAIVRTYLDDTGTHSGSRIVGVIGAAASTDAWISWEKKWCAFLIDNGLQKGWKHSDFGSSFVGGRYGEYEDWSEAKWLLARRRVWEIISEEDLFGVGYAVVTSDYEQIVAEAKYELPSDPYEFCLDRCLNLILHRSFNLPHSEGIAIFCDQSKEQERIGSALAVWHEKYVTLYADVGYRAVPTTTVYGSRLKYIPLQAADIMATEVYRACESFLRGSTREEIDQRYPILKELRDRGYLSNILAYSRDELIADLERGTPSPAKFGRKL